MRYRSAAFARLSAHALAGDGSTHFPARGVDADALLGTAALLYLLRFSGDIVTAEQTLVAGVVPPVRVVAAEILVTFAEVVRARVAAWAARFITGVSRVTKILSLVQGWLGAKWWRGKCCRTGRESPWLVYCALQLTTRGRVLKRSRTLD